MEIRWSYDLLISTLGFLILARWHLYVESRPRSSMRKDFSFRCNLSVMKWQKNATIAMWFLLMMIAVIFHPLLITLCFFCKQLFVNTISLYVIMTDWRKPLPGICVGNTVVYKYIVISLINFITKDMFVKPLNCRKSYSLIYLYLMSHMNDFKLLSFPYW